MLGQMAAQIAGTTGRKIGCSLGHMAAQIAGTDGCTIGCPTWFGNLFWPQKSSHFPLKQTKKCTQMGSEGRLKRILEPPSRPRAFHEFDLTPAGQAGNVSGRVSGPSGEGFGTLLALLMGYLALFYAT